MFVYLLPVLLIFGLVMSKNSMFITMQVSDNGSDTPSCIQNNTSCKTMLYVLDRISHMSKYFHQNTSITVNITCNQIIERYGPNRYLYRFASSFPLSIRLIGHNKARIAFKQVVYLTIDQESKGEFNLAWIGFTISAYYSPFETTSVLRHEHMNSLTIFNCKIMTINLTITNTHNVVIDSTEFKGEFGRNSPCPSITVSHSTSFTFSNNIFSTCTFHNYEAMAFGITEHNSNLTITKCTFMEVTSFHHFINDLNKQDTRILLVNTEKDVTSVLNINESCFIRNSKVKLLTVHALPEKANYHVSVILTGLDIINNAGTSALVEINC